MVKKNYSNYIKCISTEYREELALKSPFEIYYEINSNEFLHNERSYESDLETASIVVPTQGAYQRQGEQAKNWQKIAKAEDKQVANIFWRNTFERIVTTKIAWVKIIRKN